MEGNVLALNHIPPDAESVRAALESLGPFRKGPFRLDGIDVPSHWNADAKWQVLAPILGRSEFRDVLNRPALRLADVGSNNGYYLFRLVHWLQQEGIPFETARFLALDPVDEFGRQFALLHSFVPDWPIAFAQKGWQDLGGFEPFDLLLCMGILYHHTDPASVLRSLRASLPAGGRLILETMIIPTTSSVPMALVPPGRYAGAKGIWFVPDLEALLVLFRRTGWRNIRLEGVRDALDEQGRLGDFPSFRDMLMPGDVTRTIEGLPAPFRAFVTAQK